MSEFGSTEASEAPIQPSVFTCNSSWHAESELACGRCGAIICPDCLVHTPGGTRCKPCANLRRPPMYEVGMSHYALATGVSLALGIAMGIVGALFLPPGSRFGFFGFLIGFFVGSGIGSVYAGAITRVTRGKRGLGMQLVAVLGIVVLLLVRQAPDLVEFGTLRFDLVGPIVGAVAASVAWQRLR